MVPSSCPKAVATRSPTFGDLLLTELQCAEDPDLGRPAYGGGRPTSSLHAERLGNRCSVLRYHDGHAGTTDEVARPLSDIAALPASRMQLCLELVAAGPKMAGKASEPF